jgi:hypothetical protein
VIDHQSTPSTSRRVVVNAVKLAMVAAIVGIGVQTAMAFLARPHSDSVADRILDADQDFGGWTFAGEGIEVSVKTLEPTQLLAELTKSGEPAGELPAKAEGETRLLELLATLGDGERLPEGRRKYRQTISGIDAYAETIHTAGGERLVVARAAVGASADGATLLEIRPSMAGGGNGTGASEGFAFGDNVMEIARRVASNGATTGALLATPLPMDDAMNAARRALSATGWTVGEVSVGEESSAKTCTCHRDSDRMQVVVFRDGDAEQTMILGVRE